MTLVVDVKHQLGEFSLDAAFTSEHGVTSFFGPSGSGKTSLINIIAGMARPKQGYVSLNDDILMDTEKGIFIPKHKRRFGYVFQEGRLFPHLTIRQNLLYGPWFAPRKDSTNSFDKIVDLLDIKPLLGRRPSKLSGGEKQRVAIGRALLTAPRLLLMDEPLAALDDKRKAEIFPYLERLRDDMTIPIIYVSHSMAEVVRLANQVVILDKGKVERIGCPPDIFRKFHGFQHDFQGVQQENEEICLRGIVEMVDRANQLASIRVHNAIMLAPNDRFEVGQAIHIRILEKDIILSTYKPEGLSTLNIFEGEIIGLEDGAGGRIKVRIQCDGNTFMIQLNSFFRNHLALAIGKSVYAIINNATFSKAN